MGLSARNWGTGERKGSKTRKVGSKAKDVGWARGQANQSHLGCSFLVSVKEEIQALPHCLGSTRLHLVSPSPCLPANTVLCSVSEPDPWLTCSSQEAEVRPEKRLTLGPRFQLSHSLLHPLGAPICLL